MQYSRQNVVDTLNRTGFHQAADAAIVELPDLIELEFLEDWGMRRGITTDALMSAMGGSP